MIKENRDKKRQTKKILFSTLSINLPAALVLLESSGIFQTLVYIKDALSQIGPAISAILFISAGIFYAVGQLMPYDKKASFHTTAINLIIGAIVVGIMSVAATSLAVASTHLLSNISVQNSSI
ncbi:MAG: hypothetical protein ACP5RP_00800 [Candidatus Micrarchaeia archaeon]